jgi:hypothetical protein
MDYRVDEIGSIEALILLPMALYLLWSPMVDFWLPAAHLDGPARLA